MLNEIPYPHSFTIRQEPELGKMSGIFEIPSRSYLYPGLVIQLVTDEPKTKYKRLIREYLESLRLVCHVVLFDSNSNTVLGSINGSDRRTRRDKNGHTRQTDDQMATVAGQKTCGGIVLTDPVDNCPKLFFVFQDLAVKVIGNYRLVCHIIDLAVPFIPVPPLITQPFEIHALATFPGVTETTPLSRSFTLQGVRPSGRGYSGVKQRRSTT